MKKIITKRAQVLRYEVNSNKLTCSVTGIGTCTDGALTVPEKHLLRKVTRIDDKAFADSAFREITLPDSVTSIGNRAFHQCKNLLEITLGNGVESIGIGAFQGCENLYGVTLPSAVTEIGADAFAGCKSLKSIVIPASVARLESNVFGGCEKLTRILFTGTANEWKKIFPHTSRDALPAFCTIECTDGSIKYKDCRDSFLFS